MKHLPNLLTVLRIVLVPVFLWLALKALWLPAWAVFVVAALTDWLDGTIARKYNIISDFGKLWDPLADKLIVLSALGVLTWTPPFRLCWVIFALVALREIAITILREVWSRRRLIIPADRWGKLKTVLQMVGIIACLGCLAFGIITPGDERSPLAVIGRAWFWLVAAVTVLSGLNYILAKRKN